ncbi:MAG: undecaprenyl-phosphate glucose phosphotransferase, partial [Burkholderiales bacterium]|nr:undecaprenyl-phosphate glucose phosphotransferase [Burkholderiales bacterium]
LFLAVGALAVAAVFPLFNLYEPQRGAGLAEELRRLTLAWLVLTALVGIAMFATKLGITYSRVWVTAWLVGGFAATTAVRMTVRILLRTLRVRGLNQRHIAIVGAGTLGATVAARLAGSPWAGFNVLAFYDDDAGKAGSAVAGRPVQPIDERLRSDVASGGIDQVWIALPLRAESRIRGILTMLREHAVEIRFVPDIYSFHLLNHSLTDVAGLPVISLTETPMSGINRVLKAIEDYLLAGVFLVLASPFLLLIALGVKASSRGPVLYRQERVTWNGERFLMLKFRTMPVDAEAASGPVWSRHGERRATPFGSFLRRTSLDELPQFVNVLRGEMSLVGPRPERPEFVERFRQEIPGYMQKHLVKAGITGWAQVNDLRGDSDLSQRIQYDLYYIDNWSLWFDLRILVLTLWHILTSRNAR